MKQFYISVKDHSLNKLSIIPTITSLENYEEHFINVYIRTKKEGTQGTEEYKINRTLPSMTIFKIEIVNTKGWLGESKQIKKTNLYELSLVEIDDTFSPKTFMSQETQTPPNTQLSHQFTQTKYSDKNPLPVIYEEDECECDVTQIQLQTPEEINLNFLVQEINSPNYNYHQPEFEDNYYENYYNNFYENDEAKPLLDKSKMVDYFLDDYFYDTGKKEDVTIFTDYKTDGFELYNNSTNYFPKNYWDAFENSLCQKDFCKKDFCKKDFCKKDFCQLGCRCDDCLQLRYLKKNV